MKNVSNDMRKHKPLYQLIRYGLVGLTTNLSLYLAYLLITYFGVGPKKTMSMLYLVGALIGFIGHRKWSFEHDGAWLSAGVRYIVAHILGYLINFIILLTFADRLGFPHQWVQAAAIVTVAAFLFLAFRYFVFNRVDGD